MKTTIQEVRKKSQERLKSCSKTIERTLEQLCQRLEQGYSGAMARYIKAMSCFHRYSIQNMFLILGQKPEAIHVAGFRTWNKLHRKVKKGEKAIRIFAPVAIKQRDPPQESESSQGPEEKEQESTLFFRTVCVFDVSQTEGQELPQPTGAQGEASGLIPALEKGIQEAGITVAYQDTGRALGKSLKGKIVIKPGMSTAETFGVLAHEYAHELLHQGGAKESRPVRELEADAVACVVCEYFGIESLEASADYIKMWNGDKQVLIQRMERIRQCANTIIARIEPHTDSPA